MKEKKDVVAGVLSMQKEMNDLSVDKINQLPDCEPEIQTKISWKEIAKQENILYIEPKGKLAAFGKLPEKQRAEHAHAWEYVKGIFEHYTSPGETICFWLSSYPGDPDCYWEVPANTPVYVPRLVAKHLAECMKYHSFDYIENPTHRWKKDDFTHTFRPVITKYRGQFKPLAAFI